MADWVIVKESDQPTVFLGYDQLEADVKLLKYRMVSDKKRKYYELVLDQTPFYAESGGQAGDKGTLTSGGEKISIYDTRKENDLVIHLTDKAPSEGGDDFHAVVDAENRRMTENNHSATHLMHYALRKVLGDHVEQKGSLVDARHLRFDFSHFQKMTDEEIADVERMVNSMIRGNNAIDEHRSIGMDQAIDMGALAFFGEKYGDTVRVVRFGDSIELCGGTHVEATGQIGFFKITSESAIAAGIRRIEAITSDEAENYVRERVQTEYEIRTLLKNPKDIIKGVQSLMEENKKLQRQTEALNKKISEIMLGELLSKKQVIKGIEVIAAKVDVDTAIAKNMAFSLLKANRNAMVILGNEADGKAFLTVAIGEELLDEKKLNAGNIIRELAKEIKGGGGGQAHFATAGGKDPSGIDRALNKIEEIL